MLSLVLVVTLTLKRVSLKHRALELTQQLAKWQVYFISWLKGSAAFASGKRGNVVAFDSSGDWKGTPAALTETILSQLLQNIWDAGTTPKDVFIGAELKPAINKIVFRHHSRRQLIILILKFIAERLMFGIAKAIISMLLEILV